ncbi:hypothetical protein DEO72_LG10g921 [Vigna unguiculata]|uniref:Uncharacterized protein n=1 Tax=Vigna unguiculata TaxID=3917 RepID=A0A4D6NAX6_VIGUN|nr:hypothetical protein DEO72_LG10g921 [Vigna unguiculata]
MVETQDIDDLRMRKNVSRCRRERDEALDPRKRDDLQRIRDNLDDQYVAKKKDKAWIMRERDDRLRDREDWHQMKQSHEELLPKREREEGHSYVRSGRGVKEKARVGMSKTNQENQSGPIHEKGLQGSGDEDCAEHDILGHHPSKKQREHVSSNDEQLDSR